MHPAGSLNALPGGTGLTTVPLGLLPLQLVNASGAPVSGASITLTSTTCGSAYADAYNMPVTDGYGLSRHLGPLRLLLLHRDHRRDRPPRTPR